MLLVVACQPIGYNLKSKLFFKIKLEMKYKQQFDYNLLVVFFFSMIVPIIISSSQYFIIEYQDDVMWINWARLHGTNAIDILMAKLGTGFRPMMNAWYAISYSLWGSTPKYYYLLNGILFSGSMVYLYLICKSLCNKTAGLIGVSLYLFLDASFILVSKINFIATIGELFFLTGTIYYSIKYYQEGNNKILAIVFSVLAFLSKEPSLLIIPIFNITYLYLYNRLNVKWILLNIIPFVYMAYLYLIMSPDIGVGNINILLRIKDNIIFYASTEITSQFKTTGLILSGLIVAIYYIYKNIFKKELVLCLVLAISGLLPFIITKQPVQQTYLAESNIGMVILLSIVIVNAMKEKGIVPMVILTGLILQGMYAPVQLNNMVAYNNAISSNQTVFYETVHSLNELSIGNVFYIPSEKRPIDTQISESMFQEYLCINDLCDFKAVTNIYESEYIILPSSLDVDLFEKEYSNVSLNIIKKIEIKGNVGILANS